MIMLNSKNESCDSIGSERAVTFFEERIAVYTVTGILKYLKAIALLCVLRYIDYS